MSKENALTVMVEAKKLRKKPFSMQEEMLIKDIQRMGTLKPLPAWMEKRVTAIYDRAAGNTVKEFHEYIK